MAENFFKSCACCVNEQNHVENLKRKIPSFDSFLSIDIGGALSLEVNSSYDCSKKDAKGWLILRFHLCSIKGCSDSEFFAAHEYYDVAQG